MENMKNVTYYDKRRKKQLIGHVHVHTYMNHHLLCNR